MMKKNPKKKNLRLEISQLELEANEHEEEREEEQPLLGWLRDGLGERLMIDYNA